MKTGDAKNAEAPKNPDTSSTSSSSSDSSDECQGGKQTPGGGAGEPAAELDEVALHLRGYGYAAASAAQWQVAPAAGTGPQVEIQVQGQEEVEGHVNYLIECFLEAPQREQLEWMVPKRLRDLTTGLLTPVKAELKDAYREHFKGPFVQKNSLAKTVQRLHEWCAGLSALVNSGGCTPGLVSSVLKALEVPDAPAAPATPQGDVAEEAKDEAADAWGSWQPTSVSKAQRKAQKKHGGSQTNQPPEPPARSEPAEGAGEEEPGLGREQEVFLGRCMQAWVKLMEDSLALEQDPEFLARVWPHFPTAFEMRQVVREAEGPGAQANDAEEVD